jgi:rhodanese-related sulfurtransferase
MSRRRTIEDLLAAARASYERVEAPAAYSELRGGAMLIDIRCAEVRRADGAVPGAVHVPLSVLYWRLDPTSPSAVPRLARPDARVILLCQHGYSSSLAAATLRELGFERATDVIGGFEAWQAAGLPVRPVRGASGDAARPRVTRLVRAS